MNRIIRELATTPEGKIALSQFAGCYNNRAMRGGSLPSLHARGAAIDLMAATNRNKQHYPSSADMPFSVIEVFREVKRVLKDDGTLWLNLGDSYASNQSAGDRVSKYSPKQTTNAGKLGGKQRVPEGWKEKDLIGIPWMVAIALRMDGWYLRQDIIWHKPNPMPESVEDRCTKAHEYVFLLSKSKKYYYDYKSIKEKSVDSDELKNKRSVWSVNTKPYKGAHFATFPPDLIRPCILAGCPEGGTVLDPFGGSGTTGAVANEENRNAILCEVNPEYIPLINKRLSEVQPKLF